ncbi:MAG: NIPSNAP family protein [Planctomycetia bacterium]|nr:NIPSNAP family protein [Planctomycetia bacterium]
MKLPGQIAMCAALIASTVGPAVAAEPDTRCYELRVYYAAEGKLEALNARFRDHTCKLFEKHGLANLGYWTPTDNPERKLYYVISAPSREARDASFKAFGADSAWKEAFAASEKDGKLVAKMESTFLHVTDYSPAIEAEIGDEPRVFELRTYTTTDGNLDRLNARFRDHTLRLFEKHGMTNLAYWTLDEGQPDADKTLVYLLSHASAEARDKSFDAFRQDPDWVAAKTASETAAGGSLTTSDGVKSVMMIPTDYSQSR